MSVSVLYVCDSCGRMDLTKVQEYSTMFSTTIPEGWNAYPREVQSPRILCPECISRESAKHE